MGWLDPVPTSYDPIEWSNKPFAERARMVCQSWALQGSGAPLALYGAYLVKVAAYVGGWVYVCSLSPELGGLSEIGMWWLEPTAFIKAILWSMLFEGLGLGCGSGPLTGRYLPPFGGFLYWLRPGTTKLSVIGGHRRTVVDTLLYAALLASLVRALIAAEPTWEHLLPIAVLVPVLALIDRTIFLALRSEHYWVTVVVFVAAPNFVAGAKAVQLALWFWAGFSKLNHHFASVVCVMTSNGPLTRFGWLRRSVYRDYPDDLRPSRLAVAMGHAGTALELSVPLLLAFAPTGPVLVVGIALMLVLHAYITSNVPAGVPIEWNVMVVYGAFALFWAHPEVTVLDITSTPLAAFLFATLVALPLLGNLFPDRLSFLLAMRYYAGNWACSVWLFAGDSFRKLDKLTKSAPLTWDQLERFYDHPTAVSLMGKVMAFRLMHLQGRAVAELLPKAVENIDEYEFVDGEIIAGLALGWNFGDGHLHSEQLLRAVQAECDFAQGELRCIFIESQPLFRSTLAYRIVDANMGVLHTGTVTVAQLRTLQPWGSSHTTPRRSDSPGSPRG